MRARLVGMCVCALGPALVAVGAGTSSQAEPERRLAAVFAHPDDETIVGPLLAHYAARPGTAVDLIIVTNGDKGVTPFAGVPAGPRLAALRRKEMDCAVTALGARGATMLDFPDAGLNSAQVLAKATAAVAARLKELRPQAIVTWGPDGGYGHPDHRLVSAIVTQIVQAGEVDAALYYAGLPKSRLDADDMRKLRFPAPFAPVLDELLTTRVPYTEEDAKRAEASLACHASQFSPDAMKLISMLTNRVQQGVMHLRPWSGGPPRNDLFAR